jgi:hypothetical protein
MCDSLFLSIEFAIFVGAVPKGGPPEIMMPTLYMTGDV